MKVFLVHTLLIFYLLIHCASVYAEDDMKANETKESKQSNSNGVSNNKDSNKSNLKEFVPSEEVSIDKPVAFPVDI